MVCIMCFDLVNLMKFFKSIIHLTKMCTSYRETERCIPQSKPVVALDQVSLLFRDLRDAPLSNYR